MNGWRLRWGDAAVWPADLHPNFRNVDIAIARTTPAYEEEKEVREIETLYLDLIASATHAIYAENQYFASRRILEAIAAQWAEPHGRNLFS